MPKVAKALPELTPEQKAILAQHWRKDAHDLLRMLWPDRPELTLRNVEWKSARAHMLTLGKQPIGDRRADEPIGGLGFNGEQEAFIKANYKEAHGPVELARTLYANPKLMPGSNEVRLVIAQIKRIDPYHFKNDAEIIEVDYQPPQTAVELVGRLNGYGIVTTPDGKPLDHNRLNQQYVRQLDALMSYMRRTAFRVEANQFTRKVDRDIFEENFLSLCWDKPDLTPEYVLQYIQLASVSVQKMQADRTARKLTERFEAGLEDPEQRLAKNEVDALKNTADKVVESMKQMNALIKTLSGDRAKQINEKIAGASSMYPLVQAWRSEEGRKKIIDLVRKKQQAELKDEVARLSSMDSLKCELWGISKEAIVV